MEKMKKSKGIQLGTLLVAMLLVIMALVIVGNTQGQDSDGKPALDNEDPLLYDAQIYASNTGVSIDEALRRFQLQDIAGKLDAELSMNETETFAGLWIDHTPEFRVAAQFTRDGEETMKPYLKKYPELAGIVEVRNTAKASLADLKRAQADVSYSVSALGIPVASDIDVFNNSVELYVLKANKSQFDNALQRGDIRLPDKVKVRVITVDKLVYLEDPNDSVYMAVNYVESGLGVSVMTSP